MRSAVISQRLAVIALPARPAALLLGALLLLYPLAIWWLLPHWGSVPVLALGGVLLVLRAWQSGQWLRHALIALPIAALVLGGERELGLRCYPVIANLAMLWLFASSLRTPMPLVERLARLREPQLPPSGVRYTRRVTQVWSVFFAVNAAVALWTALYADLALWTLYNGALSYALCAALMGIELLVRRRVRAGGRP